MHKEFTIVANTFQLFSNKSQIHINLSLADPVILQWVTGWKIAFDIWIFLMQGEIFFCATFYYERWKSQMPTERLLKIPSFIGSRIIYAHAWALTWKLFATICAFHRFVVAAALIILFNRRPRMRVFSRRLIHKKLFLSRRLVGKATASLAKRSPPYRVKIVANETAILRKIIPLCITEKWLRIEWAAI